MDATIEYLWAAGYDLPSNPLPKPADKPAAPVRRGKKAARAKRERKQP